MQPSRGFSSLFASIWTRRRAQQQQKQLEDKTNLNVLKTMKKKKKNILSSPFSREFVREYYKEKLWRKKKKRGKKCANRWGDSYAHWNETNRSDGFCSLYFDFLLSRSRKPRRACRSMTAMMMMARWWWWPSPFPSPHHFTEFPIFLYLSSSFFF